MFSLPMIIWFIVWMVNGHPWMLAAWNVWNISALICFVLGGGLSAGIRHLHD